MSTLETTAARTAPDGRLRDPANPDGATGPAIAGSVRRTLERIPDVAFRLGSVLEAEGGRVAFEWLMSGTLVAADGRRTPVTLEGCDVCEVRGGRITDLRGYFDRAPITRHLAGASAPGASA